VSTLAVSDLDARAYLTAHAGDVEQIAGEDVADGADVEMSGQLP
jgi:hypothetical protein